MSGRKNSTYDKIKALANQLRGESKVQQRRKIGQELVHLLTKKEVRRKLAQESTPSRASSDDPSLNANKCIAMAQLWTMTISATMGAVHKIRSGKSKAKLTEADILMPHKILIACDEPDETFDEGSLAILKLPKKAIRSVLVYCLNMLADEEAIEICEAELLEMLKHLCSRHEYVAFFQKKYFAAILDELSHRLTHEMEKRSPLVFFKAAEILDSLFQTCRSLGIQMNPFVSDTIQLIAEFCRYHIHQDSWGKSRSIAGPLYNSLASILFSDPETSIGPLKRSGRALVAYWKKVYPLISTSSAKDALINFMLAYIFVAQLAGELQGNPTGDLGDLDRGSLKDRYITDLLHLVMSDVGKVIEVEKGRRRSFQWSALDLRQRRHIELLARLLAIAQRRYLNQIELDSMDGDLNDALSKLLKKRAEGSDKWEDPKECRDSACSPAVIIDSPFMKYVVHKLCLGNGSNSEMQKRINSDRGDAELEYVADYPALKLLKEKAESSGASQIALLSIICACVEVFPAGECWTSTIGSSSWHRLDLPSDSSSSIGDRVLYCHSSLPDDLGLLLSLLAEMLETNGGPRGELTLQSWILVTLCRLTESSTVLISNFPNSPSAFQSLGASWRRVWMNLFRTDLRYQAYTEVSQDNSMGDLVLTLLTKMINMRCTDPRLLISGALSRRKASYIYENQHHVWSLPAFKSSSLSVSTLRLMCSVLAIAGLSDSGRDKIDGSLARKLFKENLSLGRRKRLLSLVLGCLQQWVRPSSVTGDKSSISKYFHPAITILALTHGGAALRVNEISNMWSDLRDSTRFIFTTLPGRQRNASTFFDISGLRYHEVSLLHFWGPSRDQNDLHWLEECRLQLDMPWIVTCRLWKRMSRVLHSSEIADFVPEKESDELRNVALRFFEDEICNFKYIDEDTPLFAFVSSPSIQDQKERLLSLQTLAVKYVLSLNMFYPKQVLHSKMKVVVADAMTFLVDASSRLTFITNPLDFFMVSSELNRIAEALVEISADFKSTVSVESLNESVQIYKRMLSNYFSRLRQINVSEVDRPAKNKNKIEFCSDGEDDVDVLDSYGRAAIAKTTHFDDSGKEGQRKRKRTSSFESASNSRKRAGLPPTRNSVAIPPNIECAKEIASILITLDPSPSNCDRICQTLLGTELGFDPLDIEGDIDLRLAIECIKILSSTRVLFHSRAKELIFESQDLEKTNLRLSNKNSVVLTLSRVIDLIRTWAGPSSNLYNRGNEECARTIKAIEKAGTDLTFAEDELMLLIEILKDEDKIQNRPYLRADRVNAATMSFAAGDDTFHQLFDSIFPNSFVKAGLRDISLVVRRKAAIAVGYTMRRLEEEKVVQSVLKLIPPVTEIGEGEAFTGAFGEYYNSLGYRHTLDDEIKTSLQTEDAAETMEADSIFCRSIITGTARSSSLFQKSLFDILMISLSRPELEFACFQALEIISQMRSYSDVEEMIELESEGLLRHWVENDYTELPLALTAPNILRRMMICGLYESNSEKPRDLQRLRHEASSVFVTRYRHILTPLLLLQIVSTVDQPLMDSESGTVLQFLAKNKKLKEMCEVCSDGENSESMIYKVLRHHSADIQAFVSPIIYCEEARYEKAAKGVLDLLHSVLTSDVVLERSMKKSHLITRRIFELTGRSFSAVLPADESSYFRAILNVVNRDLNPKGLKGDLFLHVGTNATENLIRAFLRLDKSNLALHRKSSWSEILLQCKFIEWQMQCKDIDNIQLGFCIHMLTEAMLKRNLILLRPEILELLKNLLNAALRNMKKAQLKVEVTPLLQRLIGACMVVHETCQQAFLTKCYERVQESKRLSRRSCGLVAFSELNSYMDAWGWENDMEGHKSEKESNDAIEQHGRYVDQNIQKSILGTYTVLELIFENAVSLELETQNILSTAPPYGISPEDLSALMRVSERMCAQNLALSFVEKQGHSWEDLVSDIGALVHGVKEKLENKHAWMKSATEDLEVSITRVKTSLGSFSVDQRLLYAELVQLEQKFRHSKLEEITATDLENLIRELSCVCGSSCPDEIRFAASRCLGEVNPSKLTRLCSSEQSLNNPIDWLEAAIQDDNLLPFMQAQCIENLAQCLKSPDPHIALVAAETLGSLFSTKVGIRCWNLVVNAKNRNLLKPFAETNRQSKQYLAGCLSQNEVRSLQAKAISEDKDDKMWCWDEGLWKCGGKSYSAFHEWICTLSAAIVLCCFHPESRSSKCKFSNGDFDFFWRCQRMCLLDHEFASSVFQCVIFVLLNNQQSSESHDFNHVLSKSFTALMKNDDVFNTGRLEPNIKALSLAIDTLHLLCRVSVKNFVSKSHPPNPSKRPKKQKRSQFNEGLSPLTPWRGLLFGVVLKLDGLMVSRACILARRYASGLFFLDLHFDSQFGRAGGVLEELASIDSISTYKHSTNIGGEPITHDDSCESNVELVRTSALSAMIVNATCLHELGEKDALDAIKVQSSALKFMEAGLLGFDLFLGRNVATLDTLRHLDVTSMSPEQRNNSVLISNCMDELGCHRILHRYIEGVLSDHESVSKLCDNDIKSIKEKWFETNIRNRQWELVPKVQGKTSSTTAYLSQASFSLSQIADEVLVTATTASSLSTAARTYSDISTGKEQGFFESVARALDSFQNEDVVSCRAFLLQGRASILDEVSRAGNEESPLVGVVKLVDRLRTLRDIEAAATKMGSVENLAKLWDLDLSDTTDIDLSHHITFFSDEVDGSSPSMNAMEIDLQGISSVVREIILRTFCRRAELSFHHQNINKLLISHLWGSCVRAREGGYPNIAEASLQRLHSLFQIPNSIQEGVVAENLLLQVRIEESRLLECRGDFSSAIRIAKQVVDFLINKEKSDNGLDQETDRLLTDAQISCGSWMTRHKIQQARIVLETYLRPGAERAKKLFEGSQTSQNAERSTHASLEFGSILANLYEALASRVKSTEWKQATINISQQEKEVRRANQLREETEAQLQKTSKAHQKKYAECHQKWIEIAHFCANIKKDLDATKLERGKIQNSISRYLDLAIESFTTALAVADTGIKSDLSRHVFRLVSLWFSASREESANTLMSKGFEQIPTFRFIPLLYQLVSRIEQTKDEEKKYFQDTLQQLIFKMCLDHPYHLMVPLIALFHGNNVVDGRHAADFLENVGEKKVAAANNIINRLKKEAPMFIGDILASYITVADSYIALALAPTEAIQTKMTKKIRFSQISQKRSQRGNPKIAPLDICLKYAESRPCIITAPPPVRPGADYGDGVEDPIGAERITRFESTFDITETGLHRPKIVVCIGSKGGRFRQLVKGEDDLRQDAIMNQVFTYVNGLMMRRGDNPKDKKKLKIITYHVSPLSPMSGVLEWVENTIPFGNWEEDHRRGRGVKTAGAHSRYYPGEWGNVLCRIHLCQSPPEERRRSFDEICRRHSPCFRFFFVEKFGHCLQTWHEAKMNYTRSVAMSSIVGHILGIGDRHCKNILVHEKTGAVVHIDFGIVFEQGKLLNSPERVPFRLTRNIVDGMGPSGVEGTFITSAQETTRVLRKNTAALLTILSAVAADPLFKWSLSPVQARARQIVDDEEANAVVDASVSGLQSDTVPMEDQNKVALKEIAKIKAKLQGYEDSTSGEQHGVLGQVLLLTNSARDADHLSEMFPGWSPWI